MQPGCLIFVYACVLRTVPSRVSAFCRQAWFSLRSMSCILYVGRLVAGISKQQPVSTAFTRVSNGSLISFRVCRSNCNSIIQLSSLLPSTCKQQAGAVRKHQVGIGQAASQQCVAGQKLASKPRAASHKTVSQNYCPTLNLSQM